MTNAHEPRFAANLKWLFTEDPLEGRFAAAADEGFAGVELPAPGGLTAARTARLLEENGLEAVLLNVAQGPSGSPTAGGAACLPDHVDTFRDLVDEGLDFAGEIGCRTVHVVGGRIPDGVSRDDAFARYVHNIGWAAARAEGTGLRIVLEMQNQRDAPGFVLGSQAMAAAVAKAVGGPVGLLFDVFHTQVAEGDVTRTFDAVRPLVQHIQIGDGPGRTEPGTGELDWHYVVEHVRASGYTGWFGCEFIPAGTSAGVLQRLKEAVR
ncbi:hydroxypyruvate isomerase family protein [Georgenia sp. Z1491]|uniref:hydroxypyruvate isomerase family protein n=1 Tax=Georgenia sp. Z1491 TaxID=3416707 RepID=UPI003CE729C3